MKRNIKRLCSLALAVALLLTVALSGCAPTQPMCERTVFAMDTVITLRLYTDETQGTQLLDHCERELISLDATLSRTKSESDVARINAAAAGECVSVSPETVAVLMLAEQVRLASDGAFNVAVEPLGALWRTADGGELIPTIEKINSVLEIVQQTDLLTEDTTVTKAVSQGSVDLGGIGKGYAMDRLLSQLSEAELQGVLITFGSNVAVLGQKPGGEPFRVAVRDPDGEGIVGTLQMQATTGVLSVSGHYERTYTVGGEHYSHILDPRTGMPPANELQSVAVLCESGALADALSTALLVMGEQQGLALWRSGAFQFEAMFIREDGVTLTEGLRDCFESVGNVRVSYVERAEP